MALDKLCPTPIRRIPQLIHKMSALIVRFNCPACYQPIEAPEEDAREGVQCPGCGKLGVKKQIPKHDELHVARIETNAERLSSLSWFCFSIALLTAMITFWVGMSYESSVSNERRGISGTAISAAAGFLMLGLAFQVVSQLMHIRALLERRR